MPNIPISSRFIRFLFIPYPTTQIAGRFERHACANQGGTIHGVSLAAMQGAISTSDYSLTRPGLAYLDQSGLKAEG